MNNNQPIFDAITASTRIENDYGGQSTQAIIIDVGKFIETFNNHRDRALCTSLRPPTPDQSQSASVVLVSHNSGEGLPNSDAANAEADTSDQSREFEMSEGEWLDRQTLEVMRLNREADDQSRAGEPVAWLYEMAHYIKPSDGELFRNWKQVVTITPPPAIPKDGVRNITPLYARTPSLPPKGS